jgi:hypothetical protein
MNGVPFVNQSLKYGRLYLRQKMLSHLAVSDAFSRFLFHHAAVECRHKNAYNIYNKVPSCCCSITCTAINHLGASLH